MSGPSAFQKSLWGIKDEPIVFTMEDKPKGGNVSDDKDHGVDLFPNSPQMTGANSRRRIQQQGQRDPLPAPTRQGAEGMFDHPSSKAWFQGRRSASREEYEKAKAMYPRSPGLWPYFNPEQARAQTRDAKLQAALDADDAALEEDAEA